MFLFHRVKEAERFRNGVNFKYKSFMGKMYLAVVFFLEVRRMGFKVKFDGVFVKTFPFVTSLGTSYSARVLGGGLDEASTQ